MQVVDMEVEFGARALGSDVIDHPNGLRVH
jgi:hypothetical protein